MTDERIEIFWIQESLTGRSLDIKQWQKQMEEENGEEE